MLPKVLVTLGFVTAASAVGFTETLCIRGGVAMMSNNYENNWCLKVPQSSVMNSWGGGRSTKCNGGTWELYWKVTGDNFARLCYGPLDSCTKYVAQQYPAMATRIGADMCWVL